MANRETARQEHVESGHVVGYEEDIMRVEKDVVQGVHQEVCNAEIKNHFLGWGVWRREAHLVLEKG